MFTLESLESRQLLSTSLPSLSHPTPPRAAPPTLNVPAASDLTSGVVINAVAGQRWAGLVGSFATPIASIFMRLSAVIQWGDGSSSMGVISSDSKGVMHIKGAHTWAKAGDYAVTVLVQNIPTWPPFLSPVARKPVTIATIHSKAHVVEPAPVPGPNLTIRAFAGLPFNGPVARFAHLEPSPIPIPYPNATDPAATAPASPGTPLLPMAGFDASIDWGDGTTSAGKFALNDKGGIDIIGAHTYKKPGEYKIHVIVSYGPVCTEDGICPLFPTRIIAQADSLAIVLPPPVAGPLT